MFYVLEPKALIISIKVSANAAKTAIKPQRTPDVLDIRVAGVRDKGKANAELIAYLSSILDVPKSHIEILTGSTAPHKRIKIPSENPRKCLEKLLDAIPTVSSP